jgi:chromosome segregation ATPase
MSDGDFLQQFEQSIANLNNINAAIEHNTKSKDAFIKVVNDGLNQINAKIRGLGTAIAKMKNDLNTLQQQVDANTSEIGTSSTAKQQLQAQIATLQSEKDQLTAQLQKQKEESDAKILGLQQKIDADEASLAQITTDNKNLKTQIDALNAELAGKGDTQQQHAAEIQKLTDQNLQALKDQQAANDATIAKLTATIDENDDHVQEILSNTNSQAKNLAAELQKCEAKEKDFQNQLQQLNAQITQLTEQNQMLTEKIKSATTAINASVARLNELTDDVANAQNMEDVKKLFQEINDAIDKINDTLKAGPSTSPGAGSDATSLVSGMLAAVTGVTGTEAPPQMSPYTHITYQELMTKLQAKKLDSRGKNTQAYTKYNTVLNDIYKANDDTETQPVDTTIQAVQKVLDGHMIIIKNGNLMGGKKRRTRKRNKKGGYTYKKHKKSSNSYNSYNSSRGRRNRHSMKSISI